MEREPRPHRCCGVGLCRGAAGLACATPTIEYRRAAPCASSSPRAWPSTLKHASLFESLALILTDQTDFMTCECCPLVSPTVQSFCSAQSLLQTVRIGLVGMRTVVCILAASIAVMFVSVRHSRYLYGCAPTSKQPQARSVGGVK